MALKLILFRKINAELLLFSGGFTKKNALFRGISIKSVYFLGVYAEKSVFQGD